jgi:hypothetical protein
MSNPKQKTAIVLTGAVALASGAYALGSQAGDGAAAAAGDNARPVAPIAHPGAPRLDSLADRLGVDESELRDAFEDVRKSLPAPFERRDDFAEELAKELGTSADKVEAALERMRERFEQEAEDRRDDLAKRLADRLNVDPDEVEDALGDGPWGPHPPPPRRP